MGQAEKLLTSLGRAQSHQVARPCSGVWLSASSYHGSSAVCHSGGLRWSVYMTAFVLNPERYWFLRFGCNILNKSPNLQTGCGCYNAVCLTWVKRKALSSGTRTRSPWEPVSCLKPSCVLSLFILLLLCYVLGCFACMYVSLCTMSM